ncbi:MAG TPA: hypothetical protein VFM46_15335, partial [Pseudomonadales bacterium]|nr:hypothetical protein [Pseudomonadales bacterium]
LAKANKIATIQISDADLAQRPDAYASGGPLQWPAQAPLTLCEALTLTAERFPERGLLFIGANGQPESKLSYPDLLQSALNVAKQLEQRGFNPGDTVMLQIAEPALYFQILWGCIWLGVTPITISAATRYEMSDPVARKLINVWQKQQHPPMVISRSLIAPVVNLAERESGKTLQHFAAEELAVGAAQPYFA